MKEMERERAKFPRIERLLFLRKITDQSNGSWIIDLNNLSLKPHPSLLTKYNGRMVWHGMERSFWAKTHFCDFRASALERLSGSQRVHGGWGFVGFFATGGGGWQWLVAGCWGWWQRLFFAGFGCRLLGLVSTHWMWFFLVGGSDLQDVVFGGFGRMLEINNKEIIKNNILIKW